MELRASRHGASGHRSRAIARGGRLELIQGEVPPVVDGEQVAAFTALRPRRKNAVVDAALHLVGVHHGVDSHTSSALVSTAASLRRAPARSARFLQAE